MWVCPVFYTWRAVGTHAIVGVCLGVMNVSAAQLDEMLSKDSWFTPEEALSLGLATTIGRKVPSTVAASAKLPKLERYQRKIAEASSQFAIAASSKRPSLAAIERKIKFAKWTPIVIAKQATVNCL